MKHPPVPTANAAAVTAAIIYVVCRTAFVVAPDLSMNIARSWFHGIDISRISALNLSTESFILGIISATIGAWLAGYLFATVYNSFVKK
ncbi:hypothetical protein HY410_01665 [Candidatus Gottesmanbacteria bacterium]|nr:hypothetical protein [Candidatus Gottesmanbacteria bacterium]